MLFHGFKCISLCKITKQGNTNKIYLNKISVDWKRNHSILPCGQDMRGKQHSRELRQLLQRSRATSLQNFGNYSREVSQADEWEIFAPAVHLAKWTRPSRWKDAWCWESASVGDFISTWKTVSDVLTSLPDNAQLVGQDCREGYFALSFSFEYFLMRL